MRRVTAALFFALCCAAETPEQRALDYLAREVPRWSKENGCFSCHNNGDGARALYTAVARGYSIPKQSLSDTTEWLLKPADWDKGEAEAAYKDTKLARIQFAAAVVEASKVGMASRDSVVKAAESLRPLQEADGSWQVDTAVAAGSPATYGPTLATYLAKLSLEASREQGFASMIAKADHWLNAVQPRSNLDRAVLLLWSPKADVEQLLRAQNTDGGWGPQPKSPSEVFDTAVAVLALRERNRDASERGRQFLIKTQLDTGGWPETTRPSGGQSYAQHISTTAWATLALLATDSKR